MKNKVHHYDLLEEQVKNVKENIAHQEVENSRRLGELNGEGNRIREILKESIPREVFDREINSIRTRLGQVEAANIKSEGRHQLTQYIPWLISVVSLILMYLMYVKK